MVMNELRRQGVLCDVTLVAEGVRFPVHKLVVASCSPYFRAMFNGAMSESHQDVVSLEAVQANALKQLVDYIYTGEIEVNSFLNPPKFTVPRLNSEKFSQSCFQLKNVYSRQNS